MFEVQDKVSYSIKQLLVTTEVLAVDYLTKLETKKQELMSLLTIFNEAHKKQTAKCADMPNEPISRAFFSKTKQDMKIYPTLEVKETILYNKTYRECKTLLKALKSETVKLESDIQNNAVLHKSLHDELIEMAALRSKTTSIKVIAAKSDVFEESWHDISELAGWDFQAQLHKMLSNVCMVLEIIVKYPLNDVAKPAFRELEQQIYYYMPYDSDGKGEWYHDITGKGNSSDFQKIDGEVPFMQIYNSKSDYLTSQFKHYIDIMCRKK